MKKKPKPGFVFDMRTIAILISAVVTFVVGAISGAYFIGYSLRDMENRQQQINDLKHQIEQVGLQSKQYTEQEVSGLRKDWERDRVSQEKSIDKLEDKH